MKLLADHCVHPGLVKILQENKIAIVQTREVGLEKLPDEAVFNFCIKNSLVLFTFDHDFGNVSRFDIKSSQGVVIIYIEKMSKESIFKKSVEFFTNIKESKLRGRLFIIEPARTRIWPK